MDLGLEDDTVLVTGSAAGLGHSCAEAFSREGANVALVSPNLDDLAYASDRLDALGEGDIFGLETDIRDPANVAAFVGETVEQYGGLDHLVTAPRQLEPESFRSISDVDWFRAFDRSFMSVVWTLREAIEHLEDGGGTVVNVTSPVVPALAADLSVATSFAHAVEGLTNTRARTYAPAVRVNTVIPGPHEVETLEQMLATLVQDGTYEDVDEAWDAVLADTPFKTPGDPLDLGTFVAFLSSDHASFVNGATIPIDGGSSL